MIVIGCCNGKPGLLTLDGDEITQVTKHDTRGTVYVPERDAIYFLSKAALHIWHMGQRAPEQLYDGARDWHGLVYADGHLFAVDPVNDVIFEFDLEGAPVQSYEWKAPGEGRLHTNDIWIEGTDLYTCCFNWGICKNGQMQEQGKNSQPHSVIRHGGSTYYCASNKGLVMKDYEEFCAPDGFTRGLLATPDGLWVGSSADRHGCGGSTGRIQLYGWDGTLKRTVPLPTNEVYSITTTEMGAEHATQ